MNILENIEKEHANWNSPIASIPILLMQRLKLFLINHFLISPILYEGSTLINLAFLIEENF